MNRSKIEPNHRPLRLPPFPLLSMGQHRRTAAEGWAGRSARRSRRLGAAEGISEDGRGARSWWAAQHGVRAGWGAEDPAARRLQPELEE